MRFWTVPQLWPGQTVAVLASGPSMSQAVADQVHAAGIPAIAVNNTHRLAPWAAMLYAADEEWWLHESNADAHRFAGLKVSVGSVQGVHRLRNTGTEGFDADPGAVRTGGNSGYQAVHVAAHAGASRILLCGFDLQDSGGESHWHGHHAWGLRRTAGATFERWRERFAGLGQALAARGVEVINTTPGSALRCFRGATLGDCLRATESETAAA